MFFPKLRRKAKWVFAFLALAFALSFVVAGVGTGFGSGFGDYLSELFNRQPDSSVSIEEARAAVAKNPRDSEAQLTLANALIQEGQSDQAIEALVKYTGDVKNDEDALQQLAALYLTQANEAQQRAAGAQVEGAQAFFSSEIRNPQSKVSQALPIGPVTQLEQTDASKTYSDALTEAQGAYAKEAAIWAALTKLQPQEPSFFFELGRSSQQSQNIAQAITAYETYLRLAPNDANAEQVRELVKELKKQQSAGPVGTGGGG
jgi:tetratricopeptide (TPR) repeat protein